MLYRFASAGTDAQITADRRPSRPPRPAGSYEGSQSYLTAEQQATGNAKAFVPFLIVFGVLGLFLSVLIIAIVVSGAVVSATRRIGILKSLGFTPSQVARAYAAQALIPATFGVVAGTVFGNLLAVPVLNGTSHELGAAGASLPLWVSILVPMGTLAIVGDHRARPGAAGRTAAGRADAGRGPGAEGRARPCGPASGRPAAAAPVGVAGAGPAVRPAGAGPRWSAPRCCSAR